MGSQEVHSFASPFYFENKKQRGDIQFFPELMYAFSPGLSSWVRYVSYPLCHKACETFDPTSAEGRIF
jgi:hypothetical protein